MWRAAKRQKTALASTTEPSQGEKSELLAMLNVVDPKTKIPQPNLEQKKAIDTLYDSLCVTKQYELFKNWNQPEGQLLCITGSAGQGKSTLLMAVVERLSSKSSGVDNPQCLSFFIFDHNRSDSNNPAAALRNLIWLLLKQNHSLSSHLENKFHSTGRTHFDDQGDFVALSSVFYDMIDDENFPETYFVIDALDECVSDQEKPGLRDFLDLIAKSMKLSKKVRWLVSSDNPTPSASFLGQIGCLFVTLGPGFQGSATAIDLYIESKVSILAEEKEYDQNLKARVITTLVELAQANYLWINIVCMALQAEEARDAQKILDEAKDFADLNLLYGRAKRALDDLPGQDGVFCKKVLSTMAIAYDALYVNELQVLARLGPGINLMAVLEKCSSFLQVRDDLVSFIHLSAKEYVRHEVVSPSSASQAHSALVEGCLDYLTNKLGPATEAFEDPPRYEALLEDLERDYASLHWMVHLTEIPDVIEHANICAKFHVFLTNHSLPWVDHLAFRGQFKRAKARLRKLDLRLQGQIDMNNPYTLQADIREAHHFLRLHESITRDSSQLICARNTVLHCPENSLMRKSWMPKALSWIESVPEATAQNWPGDFADFPGFHCCAFSPDGRLIVLISGDSRINTQIWDAEMGTIQQTLDIQGKWIHCVAFSSQGLIAAGSNSGAVTLADSTTGQLEVLPLPANSGPVNSICFSADGNKLVTTSPRAVRIWNLNISESAEEGQLVSTHQTTDRETNRIIQPFEVKDDNGNGLGASCAVFSPDETLLAMNSIDHKIMLWDMKTEKLRPTLESHTSAINSLVFSPDGRLLAWGSVDGNAGIWSLGTETEAWQRLRNLSSRQNLDSKGWHPINSIAFSPDSSSLAMSTTNNIQIWNAKTWERLYVIQAGGSTGVERISYAPSGEYLVSALRYNGVHLWYTVDTSMKGEEQPKVKPNQRLPVYAIYAITISPSGYVAAGHANGSVSLWDMKTRKPIAESINSKFEGATDFLMFSQHDGGKMLLSCNDCTVRVHEVPSMKLLHEFTHDDGRKLSSTWSPDGASIASTSVSGKIRIWKISGEKSNAAYVLKHDLDDPDGLDGLGGLGANCVAFSPDGKYFVSGGDWDMVVWEHKQDNNTWERKHTLEYYKNTVMSICVSLDSKLIVSSSADSTIRIWNIETGKCIQNIRTRTEGGYRRMWFDKRSSDYVMTEMGPQPLSPSSDSSQTPEWCPYRLILENEKLWVESGDRKAILLLKDPRTPHHPGSLGIQDRVAAIGDKSGDVRIYQFAEQVASQEPALRERKRPRE